jgi:hypothetical protein
MKDGVICGEAMHGSDVDALVDGVYRKSLKG